MHISFDTILQKNLGLIINFMVFTRFLEVMLKFLVSKSQLILEWLLIILATRAPGSYLSERAPES